MTQAPLGSGERIFRRSPVRVVFAALVLTVLLPTIALFAVPRFLPRTMALPERRTIVIVVCVVVVIAVWLSLFWLRNIRVIVRPDTVEIGRLGKTDTYDRSTTAFRSKITEHRTNGIRSGTTRALIAATAWRETVIELPGFTRPAFNELMSVLSPLTPEAPREDRIAAARVRAALPTVFTIDASRERRSGRNLLIWALVFAAVAVVAALPLLSADFFDSDFVPVVFLIPLAAVAAIAFALGGMQRLRAARATPSRLTLSSQGIRVDEADYPYSVLRRIWLTPPAYPVKRIRIEPVAGRRVTQLLVSARISMAPEYIEFVEALRADSAHLPGLISFDLE